MKAISFIFLNEPYTKPTSYFEGFMMNCLECQTPLNEVVTRRGVLIDVCPKCQAKWLDKGEVYYFYPHQISFNQFKDTENRCPRCEGQMNQGTIKGVQTQVLHCKSCQGLWLKEAPFIEISKVTNVRSAPPLSPHLNTLPSLVATSLYVFGGMYAILIAILVFLSQLEIINVHLGTVIVFIYTALQFWLGPWLMDWSLRLIGSVSWVGLNELPEHLQLFIKQTCAKKHISHPRIGLIDDGSPQAYTYGRTPKSARLVLSRGLIKLLEPEEREAVVAHEMGHIVHWDFLFMTLAQLVPLLLYHIYRNLSKLSKNQKGSKKGGGPILIAILISYLAYLITRYLMLFFSRVREYWADRFSVEITRNPTALIGALSKISYGLLYNNETEHSENESQEKAKIAVQALGIMNLTTSKELALYSAQPLNKGAQDLKEIMCWDLWNPWASFYELHSTHPLTAKRIKAITSIAKALGIKDSIQFDLKQTESYWDDFFKDLLIYLAPLLGLAIIAFISFSKWQTPAFLQALLWGFCLGGLIKTFLMYPQSNFFTYSISSLLKRIKVSPVNAIPVTIQGTILGRGAAGNIFSEDLIIKDQSGLIFLDYQNPLGIINLWFALTKSKQFHGEEVIVKGWYRRGPIPYVEVSSIQHKGEKHNCPVYSIKLFLWLIVPIILSLIIELKTP